MCIDGEKKTPLVSIIMPAYNAEQFIDAALCSVINQTVSDWELIVIDDCSQDRTPHVVKEMVANDARVRLIENEKNMGVAKTRNRGLDIFRGKYVAFLDSDDYWHPQFLEKMLKRSIECNADITYCSYEMVDENDQKVCNDFVVPFETTFDESIVRSVITCSTVLLNFETARNYRFPTNMYHEDIALWFQLLREGKIAKGVVDILAAYRQRRDSRSAGKVNSARRRWKIYRKHLKMPFFKSLIVMTKYAYYGVRKFKRI